jgi:TATA-box binding protein (TBP) (component of TFIID and TFIIIB)
MASVCRLHIDHYDAQKEHLAASHQYMRDLFLFDDDNALELDMIFVPGEGRVVDGVEDAFGLSTTYHDVIPHECLLPELQTQFHNGNELNATLARDCLLDILEERGLSVDTPPPREGFALDVEDTHGQEHSMPVHVVNVVNTSYWWMDRYGDHISPVLLPHRFMWRRMSYMGLQVNHVRTSVKACYGYPFNATELISHPGRILETGADNHITADLMFFHTLRSFQLAGMPNLYVSDRSLRNVVTTMNLPVKNGLLLPLLYHQLHTHMRTTYEPIQFAGIIVHHPDFKKVRALIFKRGALVIVGTISKEETIESLKTLVPSLFLSEDTPEARAILNSLGPDIRKLCDVSQKVVTRKRLAGNGQLVPPGGSKKARHK